MLFRSRERCPVQEECAAPCGIVTAGGENFWGKNLGEAVHQEFRWVKNALEEVAVPMKTENPFRTFCGAVGLGSVYVKEARSRTVFYRCLLGEPRSGKSIGFFSV